MVRNNFLICFTGMDGSGKTTLSKALVEMLNKNGVKCRYVYGRLEPFILKPFISIGRRIFLKGKDMFKDYRGYSTRKRDVIERHSLLFALYTYILLFDYLLQLLIKIKLPLMLGKNIICDRYVYDTVITDFSLDKNYLNSDIRRLIKKCFYIAPKPDLTFLIDVPEEIAFRRKNDTPFIEYLKEIRDIYLEAGREEEMVILDGSKSLHEIQKIVIESVQGKGMLK